MIRNKERITAIKKDLFERIKEEHAFWSYDNNAISLSAIPDDQLIALTLRFLDLPEIKQLFLIFSKKKIKYAWSRLLVPEGDYLYSINRFFAWYYFGAKRPDAYLKSLQTRHMHQMVPNY